MVDAVILNYNDAETTKRLVDYIRDYKSVGHIMIVDNASTDNSCELLEKLVDEKVHLKRNNKNAGYGAGNNLGIRELYKNYDSKYILLANPDTLIEEDVLIKMENFLVAHPDYACVAPRMMNPQGEIYSHVTTELSTTWQYILSLGMVYSKLSHISTTKQSEKVTGEYATVQYLPGSLFLMNAQIMIEHGMYDENIFLYCEEMTISLKLREAGYKMALLLNESFMHIHGGSVRKSIKSDVKKAKILSKSKVYVIKHYCKANKLQMLVANIYGPIHVAETMINSELKKVKRG